MVNDGNPKEEIVKPEEMLSDDNRARQIADASEPENHPPADNGGTQEAEEGLEATEISIQREISARREASFQHERESESPRKPHRFEQVKLAMLNYFLDLNSRFLGSYMPSDITPEKLLDLTEELSDEEVEPILIYSKVACINKEPNLAKYWAFNDSIKDLEKLFPVEGQSISYRTQEALDLQGAEFFKFMYGDFRTWVQDIRSKVLPKTLDDLERFAGINDDARLIFISRIAWLKQSFAEMERFYDGAMAATKNTQAVFERIGSQEEKSEKLPVVSLGKHLELREELFKLFESSRALSQTAEGKLQEMLQEMIEDPNRLKNPYAEQEVSYAGVILAPKLTSQDFVNCLSAAIEDFERDILSPDHDDEQYENNNFNPADIIKKSIFKRFCRNLKTLSPFDQCHIFEVGGSEAIQTFQELGAVDVFAKDAGHSGYSMNYSAGERSKMIELANFQDFGQPHTYDLVCSSRLFDLGSGIGDISEPIGSENPDQLGSREMTLVMLNLLKSGGLMIHYDGSPPPELCESLGLVKVHNSAFGASVFKYDPSQSRGLSKMQIGKKQVSYNEETQTWGIAT